MGRDHLFARLRRWFLEAPRAPSLLALLVVLLVSLVTLVHIRSYGASLFSTEENEPALVFVYLRGFYYLGLGLLFPVLILCFLRARDHDLIVPVSIASAAVFCIWVASEIILRQPSSHLFHSGINPSPLPGMFRVILIAGLVLSPPVLVILYKRAPLLDRYLLRQFLGPFVLCSVGILAVWVIYDLQDNGFDFFEAKASFGTILHFYIVQLPQMIVMILPSTLLLGLLYSLGKMSKSNEIISMLSTGKSLLRIIAPLIFVGAYSSLLCLALNYEWAPQAAAHKASILNDVNEQSHNNKGKKKLKTVVKPADVAIARNQVYPNREANRLWRIRYIPVDLSARKMLGVEIIERDDDGNLLKAIYAEKAGWDHLTGEWFLRSSSQNQVKVFDYTKMVNGIPLTTLEEEHIEQGWNETPWNIISEHLVADHLGVPDLGFHIKANADKAPAKLAPFRAHWHYRWALPWSCLVVVVFAAPLGIGLSRRGVLGGVAAAILLFFSQLFLSRLFLVLGQSQIIPAFVSAWTTNFLLLGIGIYLIYMRSMNKDLPKPTPAGLVSLFSSSKRSHAPAYAPPKPANSPAIAGSSNSQMVEPPSSEERRTKRRGRSTRRSSARDARDFDFD